jgi:putative ABC transport system substrate-binding protein
MRRREFIALLGGAAAGWPLAARAQQGERVRRIGVLVGGNENDPEMQPRVAPFRQELEKLGWSEGRNIRIETVFAAGKTDQYSRLAKEMIAKQPEAIFAHTTPLVAALRRESRTVPIVFVSVSDPIGSGLVESLARPGGNVTGLMLYEEGITGKWLSMLKEIAPNLARVTVMADPSTMPYDYYMRSAKARASSLGVEIVPSPVSGAADIERSIESAASAPNGGLVVLPSGTSILHRDLIIVATARHRLPTVYGFRFFVAAGGLMSYGTNLADQSRQAASYIDRILRGANPADLPVQAPTKYETTINLKTAKALGLTVPPGLLVAADEVFE